MRLQASGCYYHSGRAAVAICAKCGVGVCRECAVKDEYGTILCYQCGNEKLREEHREHRKRLKEAGGRFRKGTEFIIPGIIGALIVIVVCVLNYTGIGHGGIKNSLGVGIEGMIGIFYILFSIPFCYIALNDLLVPKYDTMFERIRKWVEKIAISLAIGCIVFTFFWIRFLIGKLNFLKNKE
ncbi:hypothetical protein D1641_12025 [Colidextribacter sp. OB.20]|uniref:hypothetical protein n=1 Tax=Colidextribacter sp. OB.20 TaxID=2304568 RepID=UPI0013696AFF|nr:hypothetical protein [Colidextribacter sp. OB.20]NBI10733.1 hypothetical protein [Colidextribacter sp. OB.20]